MKAHTVTGGTAPPVLRLGNSEVSNQLHVPAAFVLGINCLVFTQQDDERTSLPVWTGHERSTAPACDRTPDRPSRRPVTIPTKHCDNKNSPKATAKEGKTNLRTKTRCLFIASVEVTVTVDIKFHEYHHMARAYRHPIPPTNLHKSSGSRNAETPAFSARVGEFVNSSLATSPPFT